MSHPYAASVTRPSAGAGFLAMERTVRFTARTASETATERLGREIGACLEAGACVILTGPLGAGKTTLVRGLCAGLDVHDAVTSPTFILYEPFRGRHDVVHVDLYRLEHERELEEIGVFDLLGGDTVVIAEWGDRSETLLAAADIVVEITPESDEGREFVVRCAPRAARALSGVPSWS